MPGGDDVKDEDTSPYVSDSPEWTEGLAGHRIIIETDQRPAWEFVLTGLAEPITTYDLATLRMGRRGGSGGTDTAHQQTLFSLVGAITVAGGHIEAEMKRIILVAHEGRKTGFDEVDLTWAGLENELGRIAEGVGRIAEKLSPILAWGREQKIKVMRDHAVHSAWCLHDLGHLQANRFARKSSGATLTMTFSELAEIVDHMYTHLDQLAGVVNWPTAVLPPLQLEEIELPTIELSIVDRTPNLGSAE